MITRVRIPAPADVDAVIDWAEDNCFSFRIYRLLEMSWEEKQQQDCRFNLELEFGHTNDALLFRLRWA
jgi:hypothetical protein